MGDDDTAQKFGRSVIGLLNSQLGGLQVQSEGFLRRGMLAQHAETLEMMAKLRKQMRENAAKYGVEAPPEALEPEGPTDAAAHAAAAATLTDRNFATVDGFLGAAGAAALRAEVVQMVADGLLKPGLLEGGRAAQIRGDYVGWADEGALLQYPGFGAYLSALDQFVNLLGRTVPELSGVGLSRQRAMIANYPAAGARYARHVDNPNTNGRKMTVILYLNPGWELEHGGNLNIFTRKDPIGSGGSAASVAAEPRGDGSSIYNAAWPHEPPVPEPEEEVSTVVPSMDRLIVFWSDDRCPHEVTAVNERFGPRLAVTTWYFDNAELAEMNAREEALVRTVTDWADSCLVWDESLRRDKGGVYACGHSAGGPKMDEALTLQLENAVEQEQEVASARAELTEQQASGWTNAVRMDTARARFRNDMDTPVAPSAGWWRDGLLASFRGAVGDPEARWERAFTSREGVDARLVARLLVPSGLAAAGAEPEVGPGPELEFKPEKPEEELAQGAGTEEAVAVEWAVVVEKNGGLVVTLHLPLLESIAGAELEVTDRSISFSAAPHYSRTAVELPPARVDTEQSTAKFSRRSRTLRLKLPASE